MSIKASLSSDGLEELCTPPTLKELCLFKCLTNTDILIKKMKVDKAAKKSEKLFWERFRLKEPIQRELVEALLDAGKKYLFMLTPNYEPVLVLAAIRMSQPEHLVKVHVSNIRSLQDRQLEFLLNGENVKSLDIHGCDSLGSESLEAINMFAWKLEYLRFGRSARNILPDPDDVLRWRTGVLRTPHIKTFIISEVDCYSTDTDKYWRFLLEEFISNLEDLQISKCGTFQTLKFLEPAKNKLTTLTLRDCVVKWNAKAWASLFKLNKLRSLDLVGSVRGAVVGENVQRLLTDMPNLTHLAVDPGFVKHVYVDSSIRGQGSAAKRLEFIGIMGNDAVEIRKAQLLANDVAYFGTVEGELCMLGYFSNRLNSGYSNSTLERLLESLSSVAGTLPTCKTVAVINLVMKIFRNNGVAVLPPESFFRILKKLLLTNDVAANLGNFLLDQCIGAISAFISRWLAYGFPSRRLMVDYPYPLEREIFSDAMDIMMNLDGQLLLCFRHYATLMPIVMHMAERVMTSFFVVRFGMENFQILLKKMAQLLDKVAELFPGETKELWGIPSVLVVMQEVKKVKISEDLRDRADLLEIFSISSMMASLRKLCFNSGPRRAAFVSAKGVDIVMELLTDIIDGRLTQADRDSFVLLDMLKSIVQDTKLEFSRRESWMIVSDLKNFFVSVHSRWELSKNIQHYNQMIIIGRLLKYLKSDRRFYCKIDGAVMKIMMKLKLK